MAYILGFFAADGYITVNKRGGQFFSIQITDKELVESIKKVMNSNHKIGVRIPIKKSDSILYRIQIGSKEMCEDLRKLGFCERKTKNMVIPQIPKKYFSHFVRGYFDGDGNVWKGFIHKNRKTQHVVLQACFTSCSYLFLEMLQSRLAKNKIIGGSLFRSKKKQFSRLKYSTKNTLKIYNFMYNNNIKDFNGLLLERKKKVFEKFMSLRL